MYRKNVAGQFLYFAMVTTAGVADTAATVTVKRCIDGGAQATAGGTVTHRGGGQYELALTQADTNGNNLSFFFTATGDVPVEKTIVTTAADPTDAVRFGLTALPNAAAEAAGGLYTRGVGAGQIAQDANGNVRVNVDTIKTNPVVNAGTVTFPAGATLASTTNITAGTITTTTNVTNAPTAGDLTATMKASVTTAATAATPAAASVTGNVAGNVVGSVGSVVGNVGGNVTGSVGSVVGAVGSVTAAVTVGTNNDKTGYALSAATITALWNEVLDGAFTARQLLRGFAAALLGVCSGMGTATGVFRDISDTKNRLTATQDANGNRSAVVRDLT